MSPLRLRAAASGVAAVHILAACTPGPVPASASTSPEPTLAPTVPPASPPASPAASQSGDSEVYSAIRDQVETIRGLEPTADVDPVTIDEAQLRENLETEIDAEQTPEEMAVSEELLKLLGLIPEDSSLRDITLDLLAGQVVGYYSPDRDELFVVSKTGQTVGALERATYAHEFTHQLQDQTFDLGKVNPGDVDQSDGSLAASSLIEGDAASVQFQWISERMTPEELMALLEASSDPEALAALNNAPAYLRETAIFPYDFSGGLGLVQRLIADGGYDAVDAAFGDPPTSTEQVMHPEKYLRREDPVDVRIAADIAGHVGNGWSEEVRDTLGELILRIWLTEHGVGRDAADRATAGWGGDRLVLLRAGDGSFAVAMKTMWDTPDDALEFATSLLAATTSGELEARTFHRGGTREVLVALGGNAEAVLAALRS